MLLKLLVLEEDREILALPLHSFSFTNGLQDQTTGQRLHNRDPLFTEELRRRQEYPFTYILKVKVLVKDLKMKPDYISDSSNVKTLQHRTHIFCSWGTGTEKPTSLCLGRSLVNSDWMTSLTSHPASEVTLLFFGHYKNTEYSLQYVVLFWNTKCKKIIIYIHTDKHNIPEFSAVIIPFFRVTWSFRNHYNTLIWWSIIICTWFLIFLIIINVKKFLLLNIFVLTVIHFSEFFDA